MEYHKTDLIRIARRENNKKRNYLLVNPLQGKHVPVSPGRAFQMMDALAGKINSAYPGERLLLAGFAETATSIGARLAVKLNTGYIQTTREQVPGAEYLYFTESHSHAAEQKLVKNDLDEKIHLFDRIVFVEDEVTTGNTILKIVKILEKTYPSTVKFSVASLLNGMDEEALERYKNHGIALHYLLKTDHRLFPAQAEKFRGDGTYHVSCGSDAGAVLPSDYQDDGRRAKEIVLPGYRNARKFVEGCDYGRACEALWKQVRTYISAAEERNFLVLGTEEFMYPALYTAFRLEEAGGEVCFHATTRSPIEVSREEEYPLHVRYELQSFYERGRRTFVYDLKKYDQVLILTDAVPDSREGLNSLAEALQSAGNKNITCFRWCENAEFLS